MRELPHTHSCFVCGDSNPLGLRLRFETENGIVRTSFVPKEEHIGFRQTVHGGLTATVLDEVMVWACAVKTGRFAYCAELNVRYVRPLRPGEAVTVTAELVENRRNKIFEARGEVRAADSTLLASGTGKYLPIKQEAITGMLDDFVGDAKEFLGGGTTAA